MKNPLPEILTIFLLSTGAEGESLEQAIGEFQKNGTPVHQYYGADANVIGARKRELRRKLNRSIRPLLYNRTTQSTGTYEGSINLDALNLVEGETLPCSNEELFRNYATTELQPHETASWERNKSQRFRGDLNNDGIQDVLEVSIHLTPNSCDIKELLANMQFQVQGFISPTYSINLDLIVPAYSGFEMKPETSTITFHIEDAGGRIVSSRTIDYTNLNAADAQE